MRVSVYHVSGLWQGPEVKILLLSKLKCAEIVGYTDPRVVIDVGFSQVAGTPSQIIIMPASPGRGEKRYEHISSGGTDPDLCPART